MRKELTPRMSAISAMEEATALLPAFLERIRSSASSTSNSIRDYGVDAGAPKLATLADKIARLISVFGYIHRDCRSLSRKKDTNDSIKNIEIHLLSILKAVKSAESSKDEEMLVDLLEYELQDNLTQWKIKAIPHLKGMIQACAVN